MRTALTDMLGLDFPLIAFSHCRDVVAAVTNSGGFGMLGAVRFTPDQLDEELSWLDAVTHGRPYGVDVLIPTQLAGRDEGLSADETAARVPAGHVEFARDLLLKYGVISNGDDFQLRPAAAVQYEEENVKALLDVAFSHPVRLVASALGIPSPELVARAKSSGVPIAALVGKVEHARRQAAAGVDLIVAQGHEAGGHAGRDHHDGAHSAGGRRGSADPRAGRRGHRRREAGRGRDRAGGRGRVDRIGVADDRRVRDRRHRAREIRRGLVRGHDALAGADGEARATAALVLARRVGVGGQPWRAGHAADGDDQRQRVPEDRAGGRRGLAGGVQPAIEAVARLDEISADN